MRFIRRKSDGQMAKMPLARADAMVASGEYENVDAAEALAHPVQTAKAIAGCEECAKKRAEVAKRMKAFAEWARHPMSGPPLGIIPDRPLTKRSADDKPGGAKVD